MSEPLVSVTIAGLIPTPGGAGIFLTDDEKVMAIFVDSSVATAIGMAMEGTQKPRPLTHDLMSTVLNSFGVQVRKIVINDHEDDTFFARLHLEQHNELGDNIAEIDARPSDCITLATLHKAPIFVAPHVWDNAEDMSWALRKDEDGTPPEFT